MTLDDLLRYAPLLQVVAYTSLTLSTVVVASAVAIFAYRNNFGWKPRCLLIKDGFGRYGANPDMRTFLLTFDLWNMRKYPVVIKGISIKPAKLRFNTELMTEEWYVTSSREITRTRGGELVLAPVSSQTIKADAVLANPGDLARMLDAVVVTVTCFDPRRKKECTAKLKYKHGFYQPKRFHWF